MNRDEIREKLELYVMGELPADEAAEIRSRVEADAALRAELAAARRLVGALDRGLKLSAPAASPGLVGRIIAPGIGSGRRRTWLTVFRGLAAAILVGLGLAVAVYFAATYQSESRHRRLAPVLPGPGDGSSVTQGLTALAQEPGLSGLMTARAPTTRPQVERVAVGQTIATAAGQRRRVALPDGSVLFVNQKTEVVVAADRRLELKSGEIFIEVAPRQVWGGAVGAPTVESPANPLSGNSVGAHSVETSQGVGRWLAVSRECEPFVVVTPQREVTALGTKFDVRVASPPSGHGTPAVPGGTAVAVTQGRVKVTGLSGVLEAGRQLAPGRDEPTPMPRASHVLDWTRDLVAAADSPLIPANEKAGGALIVVDPNGQEVRLELRRYDVDVYIEDGFARTTIDQTYFNQMNWRQEGTFYFPLPADASLSRLAMYVNGVLMEGGMAQRDYARSVYEQIVMQRRDPALLEWIDGSTFKMRVFPLEAREEKRIILSYTQKLTTLYGRQTYRFSAPAGHNLGERAAQVRDWSFHAQAVGAGAAGWTWRCDTHNLMSQATENDLVLDCRLKDYRFQSDVVLELEDPAWRLAAAPAADGAVRFNAAEHEGSRYLMLRYQPTLAAKGEPPAKASSANGERSRTVGRRDWVFLVETSADRDPLLARTQIEVVRTILANAGHGDRFGVLTVGTRIHAMADGLQPVTAESVGQAVAWLEKAHLIGALDLEGGLKAAGELLKPEAPSPLPSPGGGGGILVHLGSGIAVLGERRVDKLLGLIPANTSYVGVAVGRRWDRGFMKAAAAKSGGYLTQINPDEPVAWRAFELVSTLNTPRLMDLKVVDSDEKVTFLTTSDWLADGEEICAMAKLPPSPGAEKGRGEGASIPRSVIVTGTLNGKPWRRQLAVENVQGNAGYLPRQWARLEIDRLVADGQEKNKSRIVELSKSMYVMSPFTSLLVLESEEMYKQFNVDRGRKDHWAIYPAPAKIEVVREPLNYGLPQPLPDAELRKIAATRPELATDAMRIEQILRTVTVRIPPRVLAWPNYPYYGSPTATNVWDLNQYAQQYRNYWRTPRSPYDIYLYADIDAYAQFDVDDSYLRTTTDLALASYGTTSRINARLWQASKDVSEFGKININTAPPFLLRGLYYSRSARTGGTELDNGTVSFGGDSRLAIDADGDGIMDAKWILDRTFVNGRLSPLYHRDGDIMRRGDWDGRYFGLDDRLTKNGEINGWTAKTLLSVREAMTPYDDPIYYPNAEMWHRMELPALKTLITGGTLTLSGSNYYTGGITISGGSHQISVPINLATDTLAGTFVFNGGALSLASADALGIGNLTFNCGSGRVPILGDIPILHHAFGHSDTWRPMYVLSPSSQPAESAGPIASEAFTRALTDQAAWAAHLIVTGQVNRNPNYQRPAWSGDTGCFWDLLSYAPGFNTTTADVLAVLEAEGPQATKGPAEPTGKIDPAARRLIDKARSGGWQEISLASPASQPEGPRSATGGLSASAGTGGQAARGTQTARGTPVAEKVLVDGAGRLAIDHVLSTGLREQILCDGQTLYHVYPELGLATARKVSRFHRAGLTGLAPWNVPSAEDLARDADVIAIDGRTVELRPIGVTGIKGKEANPTTSPECSTPASGVNRPAPGPISPASGGRVTAEGGCATCSSAKEGCSANPIRYLAVRLVFAADGRLAQRQFIDQPAGKVLARVTYSAAGEIAVFDGNDEIPSPQPSPRGGGSSKAEPIAKARINVKPATQPDLAPDARQIVVVKMPLRLTAPPLAQRDPSKWSDSELIAQAARQNPGRDFNTYSAIADRFFKYGDCRIGLYVLIFQGGNFNFVADSTDPLANPLVRHPDSPVAQYMVRSYQAQRQSEEAWAPIGQPGDGFIERLSEFRHLTNWWQNPQVHVWDVKDYPKGTNPNRAFRERTLQCINLVSPAMGWSLLSKMLEKGVGVSPDQARQVVETLGRFEHVPGLAYFARAESIRLLQSANDNAWARTKASDLFRDALSAGVVPPLDGYVYRLFATDDAGRAQWTKMWRDAADALIKSHNRLAVAELASQCQQAGDGALAQELITTALAGAQGWERPLAAVAGVQFYHFAGQPARVDGILEQWLADEQAAKSACLWRVAGEVARSRGRTAEAIRRIERAMDIEFTRMPDVVNGQLVQQEFSNLMGMYGQLGDALIGLDAAPDATDALVKRVVRAADRWRMLAGSQANTNYACQQAAAVLGKLGAHEIGWEYMTSMLADRPNEGGPWADLARSLQKSNALELADRAFATAFQIEPTNVQFLWDRAQLLEQMGRHDQALGLYRQIVEGKWPPALDWIVNQARTRVGPR